jgi:hypothetical protein
MASSLERLEQARGDVLAASGPDFFRRLREYFELLEGDKKIKAAVGQLEKDFEDAEAEFVKRDEAFVRILVSIRQKLVEQEPKVNDADATRPDRDVADRASSERFHNWIWTLANFDAIVAEADNRIIEKDGLDGSRSRMLVAILNAKLHDLVIPFNERPAPRPDLRSLYDEMNDIGHQEIAAFRQLEQVGEDSGRYALARLARIIVHLDPRPERPGKTPAEKREFLEKALLEGHYFYLREALRPKEARGSLDEKAQESLDRHERDCRIELDRLHRPLKKRLEEKHRLPTLFGRISWVPPALGFLADIGGVAALVLLLVQGLRWIGLI